jgi:hypothetical protein
MPEFHPERAIVGAGKVLELLVRAGIHEATPAEREQTYESILPVIFGPDDPEVVIKTIISPRPQEFAHIFIRRDNIFLVIPSEPLGRIITELVNCVRVKLIDRSEIVTTVGPGRSMERTLYLIKQQRSNIDE